MKFRNRKTGKVTEIEEINLVVWNAERDCYESFEEYHSLAKLNEEWEDCKPKEPHIKDEKIRKAVRAWAKYCGIRKVLYAERPNKTLCCFTDMGKDDFAIEFAGSISSLKDGEVYTITELCGEEEE